MRYDRGMPTPIPKAHPALSNGTVLAGQWKIDGELSHTRASLVYRAKHVRTGIRTAIKVMAPPGGVLQPEAVARFEREAMMTARLTSPNVLRVSDFGRTDAGFPYLVMELLDGMTLREVLDERRADGEPGLPPAGTLAIADGLLRALTEAHDLGMVHRGVKPDNVFLSGLARGDVLVKLIDFGVAKDLDSPLTGLGNTLGTPTHMSPEQTRSGPIDGRADLYSLGVVLYECLAGRLPFLARTPVGLAVAHASELPPPIAEVAAQPVPAELCAVVEKSLEKSPDDRWDDARAMRDALLATAGLVDAGLLLRGPFDVVCSLLQRRQDALVAQAAAQPADESTTGPISTLRPADIQRAADTQPPPIPVNRLVRKPRRERAPDHKSR